MTVCERLLRDFKFELPGTAVTELSIDGALISDPETALANYREEAGTVENSKIVSELSAFRRKFFEMHGVKLKFEPDAVAAISEMQDQRNMSALNLCDQIFHDYQFGLKLIQKNTNQDIFSLSKEAVEDPDKFLSGLVVASYNKEEPPAEEGGESDSDDTHPELNLEN